VAAGRRLVTVGFMRRYDAGYQEMKRVLNRGDMGTPLIMHSAHRNPSLPAGFTSEMILLDSCVHDIDIARWLLASEVAAAQVLTPRRSGLAADGLQDPLILLLEMSSGALVDIEVLGNSGYGYGYDYDIRGEIVGERGTVELAESTPVVVKRDGLYRGRVPADWRERFAHAFDAELQQWVDAAVGGAAAGPSSWDGYAATVAASAGGRALHAGGRAGVSLRSPPGLYQAIS
jgi:myo-inositol 2-dehydrogenase / D-chiro-inositol 1-dehydrogenase